jgi:hypothetical protein
MSLPRKINELRARYAAALQELQSMSAALDALDHEVNLAADLLLEQVVDLKIAADQRPEAPTPTRPQEAPRVFKIKWDGDKNHWTQTGEEIAVPIYYHDIGQKKRLSLKEESPLLIESPDGKKGWLTDTGEHTHDGRRIYRLPTIRQGALKVLFSNDQVNRWPHYYARGIHFAGDFNQIITFKIVNANGATCRGPADKYIMP